VSEPAAPQPAQPAQPVLPYADRPARLGITYAIADGRVLIVIPPPTWYRRPEIVVPAVIALVNTPGILKAAQSRDVLALVEMAVAAVAVAGVVVWTVVKRRATVIELTADALRLENIRPALSEDPPFPRKFVIPRKDIYDLKFVTHSGNLFIRARGREMLEFRPINDAPTLRWIADELRRALGWSAAGAREEA
jgi:hypothetical protein